MKRKLRFAYNYLYFFFHIGFSYIITAKVNKNQKFMKNRFQIIKKTLFYCKSYAKCMREDKNIC